MRTVLDDTALELEARIAFELEDVLGLVTCCAHATKRIGKKRMSLFMP